MSYILFLMLVITLILLLYIFKGNIIVPSIVLCSVFIISLFFSILNEKKWGEYFSIETILIIYITIFLFVTGNILANFIVSRRKINLKNKKVKKFFLENYKKRYFLIIDLILLLLFIYYIKKLNNISLGFGNSQNFLNMFTYLRANAGEYTLPFGYNFVYNCTKGVSYIGIFLFLYFLKIKNIKVLYFLSPTIIYLLFIVSTTGRTPFIHLIIYILTIYFILEQNSKKYFKKFSFPLIALLFFYIIFSLTGMLTGKTQSKSLYEMISLYTGSSLIGLNRFINTYNGYSNEFLGENTMYRIYSFLKFLGIKIPNLERSYDFMLFNGMRTNVYSAIRRYLEDYGIVGLFIIVFLLGIFYGIFFYYSYYKKNYFVLILYSTFSYPIYEFPIEERFFMHLFPFGFINNTFIIGIIYYLMIIRKNKYKRKGERNHERNNISRRKWNKTLSNNKSNIKTDKSNI